MSSSDVASTAVPLGNVAGAEVGKRLSCRISAHHILAFRIIFCFIAV